MKTWIKFTCGGLALVTAGVVPATTVAFLKKTINVEISGSGNQMIDATRKIIIEKIEKMPLKEFTGASLISDEIFVKDKMHTFERKEFSENQMKNTHFNEFFLEEIKKIEQKQNVKIKLFGARQAKDTKTFLVIKIIDKTLTSTLFFDPVGTLLIGFLDQTWIY